jgi:hypothetical protein
MPCHHMTNVFLLIFRDVVIHVQATLFSQTEILNSLSRDEDFDAGSLIKNEAPSKTCMKHVKTRHFKKKSFCAHSFLYFLSLFSIICPYKFSLHLSRSCSLCPLLSLLYINNLLAIYICFSPSHSDFISLCMVLLHNLINSELALLETRPEITCNSYTLY